MYRNSMNRWWTFTLACVLGLVLLVAAAPQSHAGGGYRPSGYEPIPVPQPDPGPISSGDPDSPQGSGRPSAATGRTATRGGIHVTPVNPSVGGNAQSVWVFQFRMALQMMKVFYLHP